MPRQKVVLCWSGGKDSCFALYELQKAGSYEIVSLLTTVTRDYDRISMHGVRNRLLDEQANALGLPLEKVYISKGANNQEYETKMGDVLQKFKSRGVSDVAFGDIFLEDLRKYREQNLAKIGMNAIFPIWKRNSNELAHSFIDLGFRTIVTCVDSKQLDISFAGRLYDRQFLSDLPVSVDPCGENGEFHSFVYDGPLFRNPTAFSKGEMVLKDERFFFCDLIPEGETISASF